MEHIDRFVKEFGTQKDEDNGDVDELLGDLKAQKSSKPSDFQALFSGKRDEEDQFMFGIKITR